MSFATSSTSSTHHNIQYGTTASTAEQPAAPADPSGVVACLGKRKVREALPEEAAPQTSNTSFSVVYCRSDRNYRLAKQILDDAGIRTADVLKFTVSVLISLAEEGNLRAVIEVLSTELWSFKTNNLLQEFGKELIQLALKYPSLPQAHCFLGYMHTQGQIVLEGDYPRFVLDGTRNYAKAAELLLRAANDGDIAEAMRIYAQLVEQGHVNRSPNGKANFSHAVEWYKRARDKGNKPAKNHYAKLVIQGKVDRLEHGQINYLYASRLFKENADVDDAEAMVNFGLLAEEGHIVLLPNGQINYTFADYWYKKAASKGDKTALAKRASLVARGLI